MAYVDMFATQRADKNLFKAKMSSLKNKTYNFPEAEFEGRAGDEVKKLIMRKMHECLKDINLKKVGTTKTLPSNLSVERK